LVLLTSVISISAASAYFNSKSVDTSDINSFYGTYHTGTVYEPNEYLAVVPPEDPQKSDSETGVFVKYYPTNEIISQGYYKFNSNGYLTLYENDKAVAVLTYSKDNTYLLNNAKDTEVLTKNSDTATTPTE